MQNASTIADAEQLVYLTMGVVQRSWDRFLAEKLPSIGIRIPNELEAKTQLSMAVLAFGLGNSISGEFLNAVCGVLHAALDESGADITNSFIEYYSVRRDWPNIRWESVPCKHSLPPLCRPHELMAVLMVDKAGIDISMQLRGIRTYNLLYLQILGHLVESSVIAVNAYSKHVPWHASRRKGWRSWIGRLLQWRTRLV